MPPKRRTDSPSSSSTDDSRDQPGAGPRRSEPREVVELRALREAHPELAPAIDMQLALIDLQRRVQSRVPIPIHQLSAVHLARHVAEQRPALAFDEIPLDWTEVRLMVRQTVEILGRFGSLDPDSIVRLQALAREPERFLTIVREWYGAAPGGATPGAAPADPTGLLDQVLTLAMRPFLARCAQSLLPQLDLRAWTTPHCPLCGGEAEFAAITSAADRLLLCSRCTGAWPYDPIACPYCRNSNRARITSFESRDGRYRLYGCDSCRRYLKAFDGRRSTRGALLAVDTIATLPLDAAAIQRGYKS